MSEEDDARAVAVAPERWSGWVDRFAVSHPGLVLAVDAGTLHGRSTDGSWFRARLPLDRPYDGPPGAGAFVAAAVPPDAWGVLLVRRGGFAVARLDGAAPVASKVGRRHVQGRTKAGGQSQQRFARRRANQAREAFDAAADHAATVLGGVPLPLVTGGDRAAVASVLQDRRLADHRVVGPWLPVPDPRRRELDAAVVDATRVRVQVHDVGRDTPLDGAQPV